MKRNISPVSRRAAQRRGITLYNDVKEVHPGDLVTGEFFGWVNNSSAAREIYLLFDVRPGLSNAIVVRGMGPEGNVMKTLLTHHNVSWYGYVRKAPRGSSYVQRS